MKTAGILILDLGATAGSSDTRQILRRLRALGFYAEVHHWRHDLSTLNGLQIRGVVLAGGETADGRLCKARPARAVYEQSAPVLGIDQGMLVMTTQFRGHVASAQTPEGEPNDVGILRQSPLFETLVDEGRLAVCMPGHLHVDGPPKDFVVTAKTRDGRIGAMENLRRRLFALRFHPQSPETSHGFQILSNFAHNVCELNGAWSVEEYIQTQRLFLQHEAAGATLLCVVSGDPASVLAVALARDLLAIEGRIVLVNDGRRSPERQAALAAWLQADFEAPVAEVDASDQFADLIGPETWRSADPTMPRAPSAFDRQLASLGEDLATEVGAQFWIHPGPGERPAPTTSRPDRAPEGERDTVDPADSRPALLVPLPQLMPEEFSEAALALDVDAALLATQGPRPVRANTSAES